MRKAQLPLVLAFLLGCMGTYVLGDTWSNDVNAQERQTQASAKAPDGEPIVMLNALWFKKDGGAEKYQEYMIAAAPFGAKYGAKPGGAYIPEAALIGTFDADLIFFVEWPNFEAFAKLAGDPGYQAISHLRTEAIEDSWLIRCTPAS